MEIHEVGVKKLFNIYLDEDELKLIKFGLSNLDKNRMKISQEKRLEEIIEKISDALPFGS